MSSSASASLSDRTPNAPANRAWGDGAALAYIFSEGSTLDSCVMLKPLVTLGHALFLDFDGTLADIAPRPEAVNVPARVLEHLKLLHDSLQGALAIVTGRTLVDVDHFLAPVHLTLACEHGAQIRMSGMEAVEFAPVSPLPAEMLLQALTPLTARYPELLLERKKTGVALHFRQAPHLQDLCLHTVTAAMRDVPGAELLHGKYVFEVKTSGTSKGRAIEFLMRQPPFVGRVPLFVGDDVTDESGFAAVQALGGLGVKVGGGVTQAQARMSTPADVRAWLRAAAQAMSAQQGELG